MSIASAITTAQGRVAAAYTACNNKGATMPAAANQNLSNLATTIGTIPTGGGSSGFTKGIASVYLQSASNTASFTGLSGEPKAFIVAGIDVPATGGVILSVLGDSTGNHAVYNTGSQHTYSNGFTSSYSNGTLTITAPSGVSFAGESWLSLIYYYGSGTLTFKTSTVTPGSGVTSVTFTGTGLTEVPAMYACFLETAVNNESYRRVACYTNSCLDDDEAETQLPMGVTFYSSGILNTTSSFTVSYNNGLYINSGGTNAGGYFHNPGTYTLYYLMASDVESGGGGGGTGERKDVNFLDYDGTLVASYTATEFASLSSMPSNPSHTGLTAQGWNWSLSDAKTYVASYGGLTIGQMYTTSDGKTRLYITIQDNGKKDITIYFSQTVANGVTFDWGDNSSTTTVSGTGTKYTTHTYSQGGEYVITFNVTSGSMNLGYNSSSANLVGAIGSGYDYQGLRLKKIFIGSGVSALSSYAFSGCNNLSEITIPKTVTEINQNSFKNCYSLKSIVIPTSITTLGNSCFDTCDVLSDVCLGRGLTSTGTSVFKYCYRLDNIYLPDTMLSVGAYTFQYCKSLSNVVVPSGITTIDNYTFSECDHLINITLPNTVTTLGTYVFSNCYLLKSVTLSNSITTLSAFSFNYCRNLTELSNLGNITTIGNSVFRYCYINTIIVPSTVTSIGTYAFADNSNITAVYLYPETPPTLTNTNTFSNTTGTIYVPNGCLNAYQTASYWSTYASRMVEMPASS